MNTQTFWSVISNYNHQTKILQIVLFIFVILAIVLSYTQKVKWVAKFALGITNSNYNIHFLWKVTML